MNPTNYLIPMLELYCVWLNKWIENDRGYDYTYTVEQFMKTDPQKDLYGSSTVHAVVPEVGASAAFPRFMVIASVTDGDDGGPTDLVAWFEVNEDNTTEIVAMVQGFDTNLQFIYEDRQFINLPEER